ASPQTGPRAVEPRLDRSHRAASSRVARRQLLAGAAVLAGAGAVAANGCGQEPGSAGPKPCRYAMEVNGGWNFWGFTVIKDFKWGAAAFPYQANNKNVNYNDQWEMSSQTKEVEAAWQFIKHVASPEVQRQYSDLTGTPPTTKAAIDTWYKRYEGIMTRAELEKVTQGAIDPKRSQESADHLFIDWAQLSSYYSQQVSTPLNRKDGTAKEIIAQT